MKVLRFDLKRLHLVIASHMNMMIDCLPDLSR